MTAESGSGQGVEVPRGWTFHEEAPAIGIRLKMKDFMSAIGLMNEIAMVAEELGHHPDFHLTGYKDLEIRSWSHDVGALTERDARLAERINALLEEKGLRPL